MPIRDVAAMAASLDNDYGATHGPNAPAAHDLALFDGDPLLDGVELSDVTAPGYARVEVPNDATWAPADSTNGEKATVSPVVFPAPASEWVEASHWALFAAGTETMWDCGALTEVLEVTSASAEGPQVSPVIFYAESVEPLE